MGVAYSQDSAFAKEMVKHEATHTQYGPPGRPYQYSPLPTMLYKAGRVNDGPVGIVESATAETEADLTRYAALGFVAGGQAAAIAAFERYQFEMAEAAAARNFTDRNMGDKAKAESNAVEATTSEHVAEIPSTPLKPRR